MSRGALLVALALILAGCSGSGPQYLRACPVPKTHTAAEEQAAADAMAALAPGNPLRAWMDEYVALRQEARDCAHG